MLAARWFGRSGFLVGAAGVVALAVGEARRSAPPNESWRELTFKTFASGCDWQTDADMAADVHAIAACFEDHAGAFAFRDPEGRAWGILVDEASPLARCLDDRQELAGRFCIGHVWQRPPADARMHVPRSLPFGDVGGVAGI